MKQSKLFAPTLKEIPNDAEAKSHRLMLKGGYIRQSAAGIYSYLPLSMLVINKINNIIKKEMEKIDANEMMTSHIIPSEYWEESGRIQTYGPELYKFQNRDERTFLLGPTHEETFTKLISEVKSYKKFPITLYQIQTKFRDEKRPRFGLLRGREFIMKDAYSFSTDQKGLDLVYKNMSQAYKNIFDQIGLKYFIIKADAGAMGGRESQEFNAIADIGEDTVAYTDGGYAANVEMAEEYFEPQTIDQKLEELTEIETPNAKTIDEVSNLLNITADKIVKTIIFNADDQLVAVLVPGDYQVNDVKVKNYLSVDTLQEADQKQVVENLDVDFGSIGPVDLKVSKILVDQKVTNMVNFVAGANQNGKHFKNINLKRDVPNFEVGDFSIVKEGNIAADKSGQLKFNRGIEIGHVFKLGTKYSKSMGAQVQNENGQIIDLIMGSYGIGVSRLLSAIIEQNSDDKGISWPKNVAPFEVHLIVMDYQNDIQKQLADNIYLELEKHNISILLDDRNERPGVKFADADLIGSPIRITVGRDAAENIVEFKIRNEDEVKKIKSEQSIDYILKYLID